MTHPTGKGIFIWQASKYFIPDPAAEAEKLKAAGFRWVAVQTVDGYISQWPETIVFLADELRLAGLEVWSWGMVYANGKNAEGWGYSEGVIAGHHRRTLGLAGHIFDEEWGSKRARGAVGVKSAYDGYAEEDRLDNFGMTSYRFPSVQRNFPWDAAIRPVRFVCPQVYWERAHNPSYQLRRCYEEYRKLTTRPIIPIGAAYGVLGWEPTVADVMGFYDTAKDLLLPGYSFWNWETLKRRPKLLAAVSGME